VKWGRKKRINYAPFLLSLCAPIPSFLRKKSTAWILRATLFLVYSSCLYRSSSEVMDGPVPDPPEGFLCRAPSFPVGMDETVEGSERFGENEAGIALRTGVVGLLAVDFFLFSNHAIMRRKLVRRHMER
jgi:hypothetical protein